MRTESANFNPTEQLVPVNDISEKNKVSSRQGSVTSASKHSLRRSLSQIFSKKRKINTDSLKTKPYMKELKSFDKRLSVAYQGASKLSSQLKATVYDNNPTGFKNAFDYKKVVFDAIDNAVKTLQESAKYSFEMTDAEKNNLIKTLKNVYEKNEKGTDSDLEELKKGALDLIQNFPNQPKTFDNEIKRCLSKVKNEIADRQKQGISIEDLKQKKALLGSIKSIEQDAEKRKQDISTENLEAKKPILEKALNEILEKALNELNMLRRCLNKESPDRSLVKDFILLFMKREYRDLDSERTARFALCDAKCEALLTDINSEKQGNVEKVVRTNIQGSEHLNIKINDNLGVRDLEKEKKNNALIRMEGKVKKIKEYNEEMNTHFDLATIKRCIGEIEKIEEEIQKNNNPLKGDQEIKALCGEFIKRAAVCMLLKQEEEEPHN